ncbi:MAG: hypothetical protein O2899_08110, partial [Bacteroidetes bacterium]|nr:hypothetical protein [Bacteroidota bacterium]
MKHLPIFGNPVARSIPLWLMVLMLAAFTAAPSLLSLQYRAVVVGSDRDIDDTFNELSSEGWYPRFILKFEGDARMIFERPRNEAERLSGHEYRSDVVKRSRDIDDTMNERAAEGWVPRFVFKTGALEQNWRIVFERNPDVPAVDTEYRALVIDQGREVDDKFNQLGADGWEPMFIVKRNEEHRMLFSRVVGQQERKWQFMAKVTPNIKQVDDLYNEHGADGWEPMFLLKDERDQYRSLFKMPVGVEPVPMRYEARRIEEIREVEDKFNQYAA